MDHAADVWVQAISGELVSAAAIIGLRCQGGHVSAVLPGGASLQAAGPDCPPDVRRQLLTELARVRLQHDDRWIVILSPQISGEGTQWIRATAREPGPPPDAGITAGDRPVRPGDQHARGSQQS